MSLIEPSPETYDRILGLRVVRNFTHQEVPDDEVEAVLEAGRWTGSSKNTQGWMMAVITDDRTQALLAETGRFTDPIRKAPVTICLIATPDGDDFDIGRLAQNMMLAAAARGLGSCPVSLHDSDAAAEILGLPDGHTTRVAVVLGYADEEAEIAARTDRPGIARGRKSLDALKWEADTGPPDG